MKFTSGEIVLPCHRRLSAALSLTGDLSAAQREGLLRVAQKCPIHKLMTEVTTEISTTLSP
jgi:putative redox protein